MNADNTAERISTKRVNLTTEQKKKIPERE